MAERYLSIAREIRTAIAKGAYPVGSALPGRLSLVKTYDTTRGTIDRCIHFLVEQGIVESRHGAGTYVRADKPPLMVAIVGMMSGFPEVEGIRFVPFARQAMEQKSNRDQLRQFDAVFWHLPSPEVRQWINEFPASLIQIIINRDYPECHYVSTDHYGAFAEICAERLDKYQNGTAVFLRTDQDQYVLDKRLDGYAKACREHKKPSTVITLSDDFDDSLKRLKQLHELREKGPLLIFSAALQMTGSVMAWVRASGLQWGKDVFYVDMDNLYERHVFGVQVTSFSQDYHALIKHAAQGLKQLLANEIDSLQLQIMPEYREGDT